MAWTLPCIAACHPQISFCRTSLVALPHTSAVCARSAPKWLNGGPRISVSIERTQALVSVKSWERKPGISASALKPRRMCPWCMGMMDFSPLDVVQLHIRWEGSLLERPNI